MKHLFMTAAFSLLLLAGYSTVKQVPPPPPKKQVVLVHPAIHKDKTGQTQKKAASSTVQRTLPAVRDSSRATQVKH